MTFHNKPGNLVQEESVLDSLLTQADRCCSPQEPSSRENYPQIRGKLPSARSRPLGPLSQPSSEDRIKRHSFKFYIDEAEFLRVQLGNLFGATPSAHLVFVPGLLIGMRISLTDLGIRSVSVTSEEYYLCSDFGRLNATLVHPNEVTSSVCEQKPDAVIASVVSWRGRRTQIRADFTEIRRKMGPRCPLLIADCSHSGAAGWPLVNDLGADVVCGDPCKWLAPSIQPANLAFIWFCSDKYFARIQPSFSPFCLALSAHRTDAQARWVNPSDIHKLSAWHRQRDLDRSVLTAMFQENLHFAQMLAHRWSLSHVPDTSILWLHDKPNDALFDTLLDHGLVWEKNDGFRVIARADIARKLGVLDHIVRWTATIQGLKPGVQVAKAA